MNLPNKITLGRFGVAIVLFVYLVWTDMCRGSDWQCPVIALAMFVLAVATDALDGYYARKLGQQTAFGRIADPVADKVIVSGMFIFLVSAEWSRAYVPAWLAVVVIGRDFLVTGLRGYIEARGVAFPARWDGKLKMVLQCVAIPAVLAVRAVDLAFGPGSLWQIAHVLALVTLWSAVVVTVSSGARYVSAAAAVIRQEGRV